MYINENTKFQIRWKGQIRTIKVSKVSWEYRHLSSSDWRYGSQKDYFYTLAIEKKSRPGVFRKFMSNVSEDKLRRILLRRAGSQTI